MQRLTTPPTAAPVASSPLTGDISRDARPQLLPDGVHFLYMRLDAEKGSATLRLGNIFPGEMDEAVTGPMALPSCFTGPDDCAWSALAAYTP